MLLVLARRLLRFDFVCVLVFGLISCIAGFDVVDGVCLDC